MTKSLIFQRVYTYGVLALLFLLPFQTRYFLVSRTIGGEFFEYGSFTIYATEILLWFLVLLSFTERPHRRILRFVCEHPVIAWGALFFLYAALSIVWSINRAQTLFYLIRFTEAALLIWLIARSVLSKRALLLAFTLGVVLQSALGIYQFFVQEVSGSTIFGIAPHSPKTRGVAVVETELRRYLRAYGGLPHPNVLGGWVSAALIGTMVLILRGARDIRGRFQHSIPLLLIYAILFTALILTFSRSAWLAFTLGGVLLLLLYGIFKQRMRRDAIELLVVTALLSIFLGVLLKEPLTERGKGLVFNPDAGRLEQKSADERGAGLRDGWALYKKNPLIGSGLGTYTTALHRAYPDRPVYAIQPAHAVPVLVAEELGALGIFFALMWAYHIAAFLVRRRHIALVAVFLALASISMFDHYLWTLYAGIMLSVLCFGIVVVSWLRPPA